MKKRIAPQSIVNKCRIDCVSFESFFIVNLILYINLHILIVARGRKKVHTKDEQ